MRKTLAASDNALNRHRSDRKGSFGQTPRGAPIMRSTSAVRDFVAHSALRAFGERLTVLTKRGDANPSGDAPSHGRATKLARS